MKPYIICHMMASIDGRIDCDMTEKISGNEYYDALDRLDAPTCLSGKVTAVMHLARPGRFEPRCDRPVGCESVWKATENNDGYSVVPTRGARSFGMETPWTANPSSAS